MNALTVIPYAEFGIQSNFSFLRGASKPEELVVAAKLLGFSAIGLADRNTVAGVVRAWQQAKVEHLAYHPGCRLVFGDGTPDILAYPQDRKGWGHLCRMLTQANLRDENEKGATLLTRDDLLEWGDQMSLAVLPDLTGGAADGLALLRQLKHRFGSNLRLAVAPDYRGNDRFRIEQAAGLADVTGMALMATNDVLYHTAERRSLQDVLTAIRLNVPVAEAGLELTANAERHLKPPLEMARLFRRHPEALMETQRFAGELTFSLNDLQYNYPDEPTESGLGPQAELERLAREGAATRYPAGVPASVFQRIGEELALIERLNYARYFLTVYDIVKFARSQGILCQGRGSAANSIVCFCIGITEVGPDKIDTLFERFISEERNEPPDIDVDFEHEKREIVMQYIYNKYSAKRTALAAAVVSYRGRSALREVAKAMGLSDDIRGAMSGSIWGWSTSELGEKEAKAGGVDRSDSSTRHVLAHANEIMGFPRHLSQHVGGFVITRDRLDEIVPIVKTAMDERKMVEWDKDDLDAVKILKVDILALGMLTCLQRAFTLLTDHYPDARDPYGQPYVLATLPPEDKDVYDMICRADTLGVFQIESRAQMSMLPRLRPREFYDLVIEVAIVRPGPIQGDMVHPYLRRRQGKEKAEYPKPELEKILGKTLGVPLFQEQAMKIAIVAGGFRPGEADELRRAMATFKRTGTIGNYRQRHGRWHDEKGLRERLRRALFQADRRLWRIWLSRKPRRVLRLTGLRLLLVQDLLSRRVLRRDPEFAADGFLPAGPAGPRRKGSWRRHPRGRRQLFRLGTAPWRDQPSIRHESSSAMRRCARSSRQIMPCGSASARSRGCRRNAWTLSLTDAVQATNPSGMSGCAPASTSVTSKSWRRPTLSARSVSTVVKPFGRCARWTARVPPKSCLCSTSPKSACASWNRRRSCRQCRSANM